MDTALSQQDLTSNKIFYRSDVLNDQQVEHGFFTRIGGVSGGVYQGLNCGVGSDDEAAHVEQNREIVAQHLGTQGDHLLSVYQVHGDRCMTAIRPWSLENRPEADAMVTEKQGIALGILTADCAPVLFTGTKYDGAPVIGAAHAGWQGALGGVLDSTIKAMETLGAEKKSIKAAIGPCISKKTYEVGEDFLRRFLEQDEFYEHFFGAASKENHYMFDLEGFCALRLSQAGVKDIDMSGLDTYQNAEEFYSYRRTTHRKEADYGRQISAIMIRNT